MIDSHAHLYFDSYDDDRDAVMARAREAGVEHFIVVGIDLATSLASAELARRRSDVSATIGVHPNDSGSLTEAAWLDVVSALDREPFVAIGETGLDYYRDRTPRDVQKRWFIRHLELARRHDLPVIVHCRDAWDDLLDVLETEGVGTRGIMHCFSGGVAEVERSLLLGYDISFAGPLTYPKSEALREACRVVPLDRLHVETDCPFLPPHGHRGTRNEPSYMQVLIETLATVRGVPPPEIDRLTTANTRRLFRLA